ncbi:uncharacterized protein LOC136094498 [Hydra vulgaris]|uniref:uncharacterized protein LOC136094498 n=1 Tax=Hydra vulgaris TaxID=6087 RepID=UPI0032EA6E6B
MFVNFCFCCGRKYLFNTEFFCPRCGERRKRSEEETSIQNNFTEELIKHYVHKGMQYKKIVFLLSRYHGLEISVSTLKRYLNKMGLKRKNRLFENTSIRRLIETEVQTFAGIKGYRSIWHTLRISYGISINRDDVMNILRQINPAQSENRKHCKLKRRVYSSQGPNFVWHVDGYDKLKPYGFPIHGCIDGFSRKIIWLKLCRTNKDPVIPAHFYLNALKEFKVCPDTLRTDCGTENGIIAAIHSFVHNDINAHKYGSSQSNQRIENLWSNLKRTYTTSFIEYFKRMVFNDDLRLGDCFQMECVWFSYSELIQFELDKMKEEWNSHNIRKTRHANVHGIPDEMFYLPELYNYQQCGVNINDDILSGILSQRDIHAEAYEILNKSDLQLVNYFKDVVNEKGLKMPPRNWDEARKIYNTIIYQAI